MIARFAIAIALGPFVAAGLLFVMQLLILTGEGALTDPQTFRVVDFVRVERSESFDAQMSV